MRLSSIDVVRFGMVSGSIIKSFSTFPRVVWGGGGISKIQSQLNKMPTITVHSRRIKSLVESKVDRSVGLNTKRKLIYLCQKKAVLSGPGEKNPIQCNAMQYIFLFCTHFLD